VSPCTPDLRRLKSPLHHCLNGKRAVLQPVPLVIVKSSAFAPPACG
jgi:hypothetical protein